MASRGEPVHDLIEAVRTVRAAAGAVSYPLPLRSAGPARADQAALLAQVDDYLLPRLASLDAPMLVVVGGSTGAGKSTLVNSLVRAPVSPAGVLRPTTRTPMLACHPADTAWFRGASFAHPPPPPGGPLGNLSRTASLPPLAAPALPAGLAFLDTPDIDAVAGTNRALAMQLLAAADLWLFVTTAARYADAVPWELLHTARERGTVVALALDRVPQRGPDQLEVVGHLTELLAAHGLGKVPLFVLPETRVDGQGLLPEEVVAPLRTWFDDLSHDAPARGTVVRCTLDGALAELPARIEALAAAAAEQVATAEALAEQVGLAYGGARATLEAGLPPDPPRAPGTGARRAPPRSGWSGAGSRHRRSAWDAGLVTLVCAAAADAAEQARTAWRTHPAGGDLTAELSGPSPDLAGQVERLVRGWGGGVRSELLERLGALLDGEATRWLGALAGVPPDGDPARRLRQAGAELAAARAAAALGRQLPPTPPPAPAGIPEPRPGEPEPAAPDPPAPAGAAESSEMAGR